jgi:hypothetical protein
MQQLVDTPLQLQPTTYGISVANLAKRTDDDMLYPPEQKSSHKEVDFNKMYIHRQTGALKTFEQFSQSSNRRKLYIMYIMEDYQYHNLPPTEYFLCLYGDNKLVEALIHIRHLFLQNYEGQQTKYLTHSFKGFKGSKCPTFYTSGSDLLTFQQTRTRWRYFDDIQDEALKYFAKPKKINAWLRKLVFVDRTLDPQKPYCS